MPGVALSEALTPGFFGAASVVAHIAKFPTCRNILAAIGLGSGAVRAFYAWNNRNTEHLTTTPAEAEFPSIQKPSAHEPANIPTDALSPAINAGMPADISSDSTEDDTDPFLEPYTGQLEELAAKLAKQLTGVHSALKELENYKPTETPPPASPPSQNPVLDSSAQSLPPAAPSAASPTAPDDASKPIVHVSAAAPPPPPAPPMARFEGYAPVSAFWAVTEEQKQNWPQKYAKLLGEAKDLRTNITTLKNEQLQINNINDEKQKLKKALTEIERENEELETEIIEHDGRLNRINLGFICSETKSITGKKGKAQRTLPNDGKTAQQFQIWITSNKKLIDENEKKYIENLSNIEKLDQKLAVLKRPDLEKLIKSAEVELFQKETSIKELTALMGRHKVPYGKPGIVITTARTPDPDQRAQMALELELRSQRPQGVSFE